MQCRLASSPCIQRRFGSTIDAADPGSGSYIAGLKNRIRVLEAQAQTHEDANTPTNASSTDEPTVQPHGLVPEADGAQPDSPVMDPSLERHRPQSDLQDAMHEVSYISLSAMAEPTDRRPFSTQGLSFSTLLFTATSISGDNPSLPEGSNTSLSGPLADLRKNMFSAYGRLDGLQSANDYQCYAERISRSFPFMSRAELDGLYEDVVKIHNSDNSGRMVNENPEKVVITYIGTALGLLWSQNYTYTEIISSELAMKAIQLMSRVLDHATDLSVIRCLTALTVYSLYTSFGGSTWHLLGLAMTRCISSGYHTTRASDPRSEDEEKRHNSRAFWALYILDTYVSTSLDRPFCLNDQDIMVSPPRSPRSSTDDSADSISRHLVQHAQILRAIRKEPGTDILCSFVNLRHWKETLPPQPAIPPLQQSYLYTLGFIELLKTLAHPEDPDCKTIIHPAEQEFCTFLDLFEAQLTTHSSAPAALDGHHVFAIGVVLTSRLRMTDENSFPQLQHISQCVNILTMLSTRYTAVRSLRDVLAELVNIVTRYAQQFSYERLRTLVSRSEVAISSKLQSLIFGVLNAGNEDEPTTS